MESKMKNPTHTFLKRIKELRIKSKTDKLELIKEKRLHFF